VDVEVCRTAVMFVMHTLISYLFFLERRFLDNCTQLQIQRAPVLMHTEFKEAKSLLFCVCR
jgi:uncharacterized membrane protein (GlpM family)